jgi:hypothetical protein
LSLRIILGQGIAGIGAFDMPATGLVLTFLAPHRVCGAKEEDGD